MAPARRATIRRTILLALALTAASACWSAVASFDAAYAPGLAPGALAYASSLKIDQWSALENQNGVGKLFDLTRPMDRLVVYKLHTDIEDMTPAAFTELAPARQKELREEAEKAIRSQVQGAIRFVQDRGEDPASLSARDRAKLAQAVDDLTLFHYAVGDAFKGEALEKAYHDGNKLLGRGPEAVLKAAERFSAAFGEAPENDLPEAGRGSGKNGIALQPAPAPIALPTALHLGHIHLTQYYADSTVRIISDLPLSGLEARTAAHVIKTAYLSNIGRQGWTVGTRGPIDVVVLSQAPFHKLAGDADGITTDADHFFIPAKLLKNGYKFTTDDVDTQAHELTHILQSRGGGKRARYVPTYIQEGQAYVGGALETASRGLVNPEAQNIHKQLGELTAVKAKYILGHLRNDVDESRTQALHLYETTGGLFVEFLRTRPLNGKSHTDALARLSYAIEDVGRGSTYAAAFKKRFGVTEAAAQAAFLQYLRDTKGHPDARLKDTIWQSAEQNKIAPIESRAVAGIAGKKLPELPSDADLKETAYGFIRGAKLFIHAPKGEDIEQDQIGDCYREVAASEFAKQHPDILMKMIRQNPNGTYDVVLFRRKSATGEFEPYIERVAGKFPMLHGRTIFEAARKGEAREVWTYVYQQAYAQSIKRLAPRTAADKEKGAKRAVETGYAAENEGGYSGHAMQTMVGAPAVHIPLLKADKMEIFAALAKAEKEGKLTETETYNDGSGPQGVRRALKQSLRRYPSLKDKYNPDTFVYIRHGMETGHAHGAWSTYTRQKGDPQMAGGPYFVIIRNPWGSFEPPQWKIPDWLRRKLNLQTANHDDGFFAMPLDDFMVLFQAVWIGEVPGYLKTISSETLFARAEANMKGR